MPSSPNYKRNYKRERVVALKSPASNKAANASRKKARRVLEKGGVVKAIEVIDNHRREVEKNVEEGMKIAKTNRKKLDEYTDYLFGVLEEDIKIRKEKNRKKSKP